jgi:hypothetical protein
MGCLKLDILECEYAPMKIVYGGKYGTTQSTDFCRQNAENVSVNLGVVVGVQQGNGGDGQTQGNTTTGNTEQSQDTNSPKVPQKGDKFIEGVRIRHVSWIGNGGGMTLPGIGIFIGAGTLLPQSEGRYYTDNFISILYMHEYGHIKQAKDVGYITYYLNIAPSSFMSAIKDGIRNIWNSIMGKPIQNYHMKTPIEIDASRRGYYHFNPPYWDIKNFPLKP